MLIELEGVKFSIDDPAIDFIARQAVEFNTGARGLRALFEHIMLDIMYDAPSGLKSKELNINLKFVKSKLAELKLGISKNVS